jgi:hypothetical protein
MLAGFVKGAAQPSPLFSFVRQAANVLVIEL